MLFPQTIIDEIKLCAHWADRLIRSELIAGVIVSENDYTSNFTGALRREINSRSIPGLNARIQVLNPRAERRIGADACIILQSDKELKAAVFEGKWPRLSTHVNYWDSLQKGSGISHFDSQLDRQALQGAYLAAWEMFYSEEPFCSGTNHMPDFGSACVWHAEAAAVSGTRTRTLPWSDTELLFLLAKNTLKIEDIFQAICECSKGEKLPLSDIRKAFGDLGLPRKALVISYAQD